MNPDEPTNTNPEPRSGLVLVNPEPRPVCVIHALQSQSQQSPGFTRKMKRTDKPTGILFCPDLKS